MGEQLATAGVLVLIVGVFVLMLRRVLKKYTAMGVVWFCVGLSGFALVGISGIHSTRPSYAPRLTANGKAHKCVVHQDGKLYTYSFSLTEANGTEIETATRIKPPLCWSGASASEEPTYRVVYLGDSTRSLNNEAIHIEVIAGQYAGWTGSVDARPLGTWLGIPAGLVVVLVGMAKASQNKHQASEPESSAPDENHCELI